jgi:type I restriction enzyme S subunit
MSVGLQPAERQLPAQWRRMKLKYVAKLQSGTGITADSIDETGPYAVYGGNGIRGFTTDFTHQGKHILIGRQGALCGNINYAEGQFWASEHAVVVELLDDHEVLWLGELLRAMNLNQYSQSAAQPGLAVEFISNLEIPVPPHQQQRAIADFLDTETAQIDELIAAKETLLTILAEKRRALVSKAVTYGLDPNVKMRDSGVPWLGDIPAHWEIERSRWLFRVRDDRSETGNEELLTVSHITGVTPRSEKDVNMFEAESTVGYKVCQPGDLVINTMWAWMGAMGIAPCVGIVSPSYHVYHVGDRLAPAYVDAIVRTQLFAKEVTRFSKGVWSSRLRLYPEGFFEVMFPVPPIEEQQEIVDFIRREQQQIDGMSSAVEKSLVLLRERREAVIAAAVTGQLDVGAA